jgi:hypothetical protein
VVSPFVLTLTIVHVFVSLQGELTDIGRQSTYLYGVALRKLYIERCVYHLHFSGLQTLTLHQIRIPTRLASSRRQG